MPSSWGDSWGLSWGDSWGSITTEVEDQQGYSYEDQIADRHQKKLKLIQDKELILIMTLTTPTF